MPKSVSASVKQLLQKYGDKLASRQMGREELVKAAESLAKESRSGVGRSWGDQMKDGKVGPKLKK